VIAARILSVLAAIFLVTAFAVASIWPPDMLLKSLIDLATPDFVPQMQQFISANLPPWAWTDVTWPLLQRPAWLLPTAIGLVFFGGAISLSGPKGSRTRPRRWRG
jgi:hypothetical protein